MEPPINYYLSHLGFTLMQSVIPTLRLQRRARRNNKTSRHFQLTLGFCAPDIAENVVPFVRRG